MKNTTCFKEFATYASLNVLGMLGLSCYILADTFFVSKGLGATGLTSLNLAIPIYSFIHGSGLMFGMGGATKYAIFKSQKQMQNANSIFTNTVLLTISFAVLFCLAGIFFSGAIAQILGADDAVLQMSKTYLQVILMFAPMFMINNTLLCFVRNDGSPHLSMIAMIGGSLSNIVLDYLFIFPLHMGMFGAAFATSLAPMISILILSPYFFKKKNSFRLIKCPVSIRLICGIVSSGLPSFITEVSSGIVIIIFNIIILQLQGNIGVAAYGVIANLSLVILAVYTGIAQGIQPIISSNYGSGHHTRVQAILRYALITMSVISVLAYMGIFFGADPIAAIFNSEQNTRLQSIAVTGLKIYFAGCIFAGCNIIISVYFTSTEHPRPAHIISILRGFVLMIPMAFFLSYLGQMIGVWCVFPLTEFLVCIISVILYMMFRLKAK